MPTSGANTNLGEDYATGATLMLKPFDNLDLHLVGIYGHLQNPFGSWATGQSGPFHSINADQTECDHREPLLRLASTRATASQSYLEPFFVYLLGTATSALPAPRSIPTATRG